MRQFFLLMLGLCISSIAVTGCGGGGGGGGEKAATDLTYPGLTTAATVTSNNASTLADTAINGTDTATTLALSAAPVNDTGNGENPYLVGFTRTLTAVVQEVDPNLLENLAQVNSSKATQTETDSLSGTCGGSVAFSLSRDDVSGQFNGSMTFNGFDECNGVTITGPVTVSGEVDPNFQDFAKLTLNFNKLTSTTGSSSEVLSGTVVIESTGVNNYRSTLNLVYSSNSGTTYKLENYLITFNESTSPTTVSISGRAYHPEYGYVNITTTTAIQINYYDDYPQSGTVIITGANGPGGGQTTGTINFNNNNAYTIDVDSDGNGAVDTSLSCTWNPDSCS